MEGKRSGDLDPDVRRGAGGAHRHHPRKSEPTPPRRRSRSPTAPTSRSTRTIFTPPFVGSRVAKGISLDDIAGYVNETALFRGQWQFRPDKAKRENDDDFQERIRPMLREQLDIAKPEGCSSPRSRGDTSR